mmetsp:Transcript_32878/g.71749  ORF Transcript_32878/g.71749 Transcript_32878/m.71749 type:complete len:558 (+) Transcript_32878:53-1726(+)|eukprot:CAMPEP_0170609764 /NCGR_PEP_ID=MMETSP0224-20130122/22297_1 /TAXON_ID=285029 /ORGANISM="Togula jolla, Strain CCCM 725" /LENGTH=557 /DNA_ID=CAMNT_0010935089 /DNA_START=49 /DNA_END=1722 /DNA_ORIENTATION=+
MAGYPSKSYYGTQRQELVKKLRSGVEEEKLEGLAEFEILGESGVLALEVAGEAAALLDDPSEEVRMSALAALGAAGQAAEEYAEDVVEQLKSSNVQARVAALLTLGRLGPLAARCGTVVAKLLNDDSPRIRSAACVAIGHLGLKDLAEVVAARLRDAVPDVISGALTALTMLSPAGARYADEVRERLTDVNSNVRHSAVMFFAKNVDLALPHGSSFSALLLDEDSAVRQAVLSIFEQLKDRALGAMLEAACAGLETSDPRFRSASASAIAVVGPAAKSYASRLAPLLSDTSEDRRQRVLSVAGLECTEPAELRIPACAAMAALAAIGDEEHASEIGQLLAHPHTDVQVAAARALGEMAGDFGAALLPLLDSPQATVRAAAATALGKRARSSGKAQADVVDAVAECLEDMSPIVRAAAAEALGNMGEQGSVFTESLLKLFRDKSAAVKAAAVRAMAAVGLKGQMYAAEVCRMTVNQNGDVSVAAIHALAAMDERGAAFADEVAPLLGHPDYAIRVAAAEALTRMGDEGRAFKSGIQALAKQDKLQEVREAAARALSAF